MINESFEAIDRINVLSDNLLLALRQQPDTNSAEFKQAGNMLTELLNLMGYKVNKRGEISKSRNKKNRDKQS